jgi:hypothetical protein
MYESLRRTYTSENIQDFAHPENIAFPHVRTKERAPVTWNVTSKQPLHRWNTTRVLLVIGRAQAAMLSGGRASCVYTCIH